MRGVSSDVVGLVVLAPSRLAISNRYQVLTLSVCSALVKPILRMGDDPDRTGRHEKLNRRSHRPAATACTAPLQLRIAHQIEGATEETSQISSCYSPTQWSTSAQRKWLDIGQFHRIRSVNNCAPTSAPPTQVCLELSMLTLGPVSQRPCEPRRPAVSGRCGAYIIISRAAAACLPEETHEHQ